MKNLFIDNASFLSCLRTEYHKSTVSEEGIFIEKFQLKIKPITENLEENEKFPYPFLNVNDGSCLARVMGAQLESDANSVIEDLLVFIQRDEYFFQKEELWPVNNVDVMKVWQRAFSRFQDPKRSSCRLILFEGQKNPSGGYLPFNPLLFCKHQQLFFGPVCPKCEQSLEQCCDDDILEKFDLSLHSKTLTRYLFCPGCYQLDGDSDFYIKVTNDGVSPHVKDFNDLIEAYKNNLLGKVNSTLPCQNCSKLNECFGKSGLAEKRIISFSFYPFFMMAFKAPTMNAADFLMLLSGASPAEVQEVLSQRGESGRANTVRAYSDDSNEPFTFFYDFESKHFLEILFLKLSFLRDLIAKLFQEQDQLKFPDLNISLDQIWVKLDKPNRGFPYYWNFRVEPLDFGGGAFPTVYLPKLPPFYSIHYLSILWFYTLLSNKNQSVREIHLLLNEMLAAMAKKDGSYNGESLSTSADSMFSPANIFWDPNLESNQTMIQENLFPKEWLEIWKECLHLGWSLLKTSMGDDPDCSTDHFLSSLDNLLNSVKEKLFSTAKKQDLMADTQGNSAIHSILSRLLDKWEIEAGKDTESEEDLLEIEFDDQPDETIVVFDENQPLGVGESFRVEKHESEMDDIPETIISTTDSMKVDHDRKLQASEDKSLADSKQKMSPSDTDKVSYPMELQDDDDLDKTVILGHSDQHRSIENENLREEAEKDGLFSFSNQQKGLGEPESLDENDLEETIVWKNSKTPEVERRVPDIKKTDKPVTEPPAYDDDIMSETVFISTDDLYNRMEKQQEELKDDDKTPDVDLEHQQDEDDLEKTVFIDPDKLKGKKR